MKLGRQDRANQGTRSRGRRRARGSLTGHPAFAPMLGLWGAALGGFVVLVLPGQMVTAALANTGMATMGASAQYVIAGGTALLLGAVLFIGAASLANGSRVRRDPPSIAEVASRRVRPIDPARDLGSRSLDEPVETSFFGTPAPASAPSPAPTAQPGPEPEPAPRALDQAEFAQLPGRNAVWVDEAPAPLAAPAPAPTAAAPAPAPAAMPVRAPLAAAAPAAAPAPAPAEPARAADPGAGAISRLRATPTAELSLAEMVERFAAALHDHRAAAAGTPGHNRDLAARDAALAEALKALAALSTDPQAPPMGEPLRDALTQLQRLRGAA